MLLGGMEWDGMERAREGGMIVRPVGRGLGRGKREKGAPK